MVATYKQSVKEKSRRSIWEHAVATLTSKRKEARMLDAVYLTKLAEFVEKKSGWMIDPFLWSDYLHFVDLSYGPKSAEELKVAFFCGPEPENDVEVLLSLGVRLENMYAFELGKDEFKQAVSASLRKHPIPF